ncbi:hypothetical protein RRG08_028344 [Elysia crispata]|uniref:Uncharacterized protein n=1 Tax=Elysia crispata TaxID=231223 RepID=A0AAE1AW78_9GAST|nr:hypothetical protein RRG08_028344 [Elysia crispata]
MRFPFLAPAVLYHYMTPPEVEVERISPQRTHRGIAWCVTMRRDVTTSVSRDGPVSMTETETSFPPQRPRPGVINAVYSPPHNSSDRIEPGSCVSFNRPDLSGTSSPLLLFLSFLARACCPMVGVATWRRVSDLSVTLVY